MPIYEYKCDDCSYVFDKLVSMSNTDPIECPQCKSEQTTKLLSAFASSAGNSSSGSSCGPTGSGFT